MRGVADYPQHTPRWVYDLIKRLSKLEQGKMYDIVLFMPEDDGDPSWAIKGSAKMENSR